MLQQTNVCTTDDEEIDLYTANFPISNVVTHKHTGPLFKAAAN